MVELHINYYAFIPIFEQIINVTIHYNHKGCTWKSFLKNEHLQELYTSGKSSKYKKVPAQVVRKFPLAVRILQQIKVIQDIWRYPGYNFEKLEGTNQYSMRMDRTWRLIMEIDWTNEEKTVGIIGLEDLTHHYQ